MPIKKDFCQSSVSDNIKEESDEHTQGFCRNCCSSVSPIISQSVVTVYEEKESIQDELQSSQSSDRKNEIKRKVQDKKIIKKKNDRKFYANILPKTNQIPNVSRLNMRNVVEKRNIKSIDENTSKENDIEDERIWIQHSKCQTIEIPILTLYEAFGTVHAETFTYIGHVRVVVEIMRNGLLKRFLVPHERSFEGRWQLYGKHVYIFMGHSFIQQKPRASVFSCFVLLNKSFRIAEEWYKCRDCSYSCHSLTRNAVPKDCPLAKIYSLEMEFPYDPQD
ncbi:uncharacterized protein LOC118193797 [Stegodyphus dumicola]|uniref:uncharacterized protein LOC118193797 n=1 Tax=Stegodyphus dumicola TaxID=202533 RepID=UPI0015A7A693|nr:uncharacterized protein LOC118193797 [Stegodyphus dumicola]